MSSFFDKILSSKPKVNTALLESQALLSFESSQLDKVLLKELLISKDISEDSSRLFLEEGLSILPHASLSLEEELHRMEQYLSLYKKIRKEGFFLQVRKGEMQIKDLQIKPFILFPLIQNAIHNGYTAMEKFPIRIKINVIASNLKLEVSNRVNHYLEAQGETDIISFYKSRLLIEYPDKHNLFINSNSNLFKATLLLDLG